MFPGVFNGAYVFGDYAKVSRLHPLMHAHACARARVHCMPGSSGIVPLPRRPDAAPNRGKLWLCSSHATNFDRLFVQDFVGVVWLGSGNNGTGDQGQPLAEPRSAILSSRAGMRPTALRQASDGSIYYISRQNEDRSVGPRSGGSLSPATLTVEVGS